MRRNFVVLAVAALVWVGPALAQRGPAPLPSPEVKPDRTVVFRLNAPQAKAVEVRGEWGAAKALTKDERGEWSVTVGPLEPDLYSYSFRVDGATVVDPRNTKLKIGRGSMTNLLEVPGLAANDLKPVPHGTLHTHRYESTALGGKSRGLTVYTPPGYETSSAKYPVLYLLHGAGDDERGWTDVGLAHRILDNLIAAKKAVPMVVVMPDGHAADRNAQGGFGNNTVAFESDLLKDIMPLVEKTYRVKTDAASRAIAGLSMGGGQTWTIGMGHPDLFTYVCPFSAAVGNASATQAKLDPSEINKKLKLVWIACGKQDFLYAANEKLIADLKAKGINHVWRSTEGAHTWKVWRAYLAEVTPLLFQ